MKRVLMLLTAISLVTMLVSCGGQHENASSPDSNRIITLNSTSNAFSSSLNLVMEKEGFLGAHMPEDVMIEWSHLSTGPEIRDAIISGSVDIGDVALNNYIAAYQNGLPLWLISAASPVACNLYTNIPGAQSLADLPENCKISLTGLSTNLHLAFMAYAYAETGDYNSYAENLTPTPNPEALAAISEGIVAASVFSFPTFLKTNTLENVHVLADLHDVITEYNIGSVFITTEAFYNNNPDIIEAFRLAQQDAIKLYQENPERYAEILAEEYGVDTQIVSDVLNQYPPTTAKITGYDKQAQMLHDVGILEKEPTKFADLPNYSDLVA